MKYFLFQSAIILLLTFFPGTLQAQQPVHHEINVIMNPETHHLQVEDTITFPRSMFPDPEGNFHFLIHRGLRPVSLTAGVKIIYEKEDPKPLGFGLSGGGGEVGVRLEHYTVKLPIGLRQFVMTYEGEINHPLISGGEGDSGGSSGTPGMISNEGVFLSGETFWYPWFYTDLVTFSLDLTLPKGWNALSQGGRVGYTRDENDVRVRWVSREPQEEIYLVAGEWSEYLRQAGKVLAMVFLRTPDPELAQKYLEVTEQYLEMYEKLLGPYPYPKFALVENFWETGYGMPSFTLLGSKIIRFPFILHSSYPHEILHNWWGNGVYVDRETGNWSEGLTTYLADYLIQEQRGEGKTARHASLQKYTDYATEGKDFPLTDFQERYDTVSQAVGYGKTMAFFHMLRLKVGDEIFIEALRKFFHENKFRRASFTDLKQVFSRVSALDLDSEFEQWVTRSGAPTLHVSQAKAQRNEEGYVLTAKIRQKQKGEPYRLDIPLAVTLEGRKEAYQTTILLKDKAFDLSLQLPARPLRLDLDPEYDLFRRLDPEEAPPSISQMFGAKSVVILLPATARGRIRGAYQRLAQSWKTSLQGEVEIMWDNEVDTLPEDRAVWLLGWENRFQHKAMAQLRRYNLVMTSAMARIGRIQVPRRGHSLVLAARHPRNKSLALAWMAVDHPASLGSLARKIQHYGQYGYLAFKGKNPVNVVKGKWPVKRSPISVRVKQLDGGKVRRWPRGKLPSRRALAVLPPVISSTRMMKEIDFLTDPVLKGRGFSMPELDLVSDFIAKAFREANLKPAGDIEGSYIQIWREEGDGRGSEVPLKNVIGFLPGSRPEWSGQGIIVGAHYDHLGLGWLEGHEGNEGKIHPGADDNASGIAVLLELARTLAQEEPLERPVVFVAFAAGEVKRLGSKYYTAHPKPLQVDKIFGMLNIDMVGRLEKKDLIVYGTGSAREWTRLFRDAGFKAGVPVKTNSDEFGSSDQKSFLDAGIPAVQISSGISPDFHLPSDTTEKIDKAGLVKAVKVVREVVKDLAARSDPMTSLLYEESEPEPKSWNWWIFE
ncbi:MAG: M20/M25/M40 family metallo-hydrolase [Nitrospiria bacterium]